MTWATMNVQGKLEVRDGIPSLTELQEAVNGYVQVVEVLDGVTMWLDEEGKLKLDSKEQANAHASFIAVHAKAIAPSDWIAGPVAFTGGPDARGETTSLTEEQVAELEQLAKRRLALVWG